MIKQIHTCSNKLLASLQDDNHLFVNSIMLVQHSLTSAWLKPGVGSVLTNAKGQTPICGAYSVEHQSFK